MSFSKLPKGVCGGLMGLGWLSIFGGTSHELVRVEPEHELVRVEPDRAE